MVINVIDEGKKNENQNANNGLASDVIDEDKKNEN